MLFEVHGFRKLSQYNIARFVRLLTEKPMQTLDFITPKEAIAICVRNFCPYI